MCVPTVVRTSYTVYVTVINIQENAISCICSMAKLIGMLLQVYVRPQCGPYILYSVRDCGKHTGKRHFAHMFYGKVDWNVITS